MFEQGFLPQSYLQGYAILQFNSACICVPRKATSMRRHLPTSFGQELLGKWTAKRFQQDRLAHKELHAPRTLDAVDAAKARTLRVGLSVMN